VCTCVLTVHSSVIDSNDAPVFKSSKIRRELWSAEDTNAFFDGLNEFGKDFESIQWFMVHRAKRKGSCEQAVKSKEQIRHFYYRTWHKIYKYIEFPKGNYCYYPFRPVVPNMGSVDLLTYG